MTATHEGNGGAPMEALTVEQLLRRSLPEKPYAICLDGSARAAVTDAEMEVDRCRARLSIVERNAPLQERLQTELAEAEERLDEARKAALPHTVNIRLRGLNRPDFDDLQAKFPPGDEEKAKAKKENRQPDRVDLETFGPALIASVVLKPPMTLEEATELWSADGWTGTDVLDLYITCRDLCSTGGATDLGNALRSTQSSGLTSTGATAKQASRTRSSSAAKTDGPTVTEPSSTPG